MDLPRARVGFIRKARKVRGVLKDEPPRTAPAPVNGYELLEKVADLPISTWSYTWDPDVRHLGPMAQDFAAAFGLGDSDRRIWHLDEAGVALVAIQALHRKVTTLEAEVESLRARLGEQ